MKHCEYVEVNNDDEIRESKTKSIQTKPFYRQLLVASGVFISAFVYGMCIGAPTVIIPQLRKEANKTKIIITNDMASWLSSAIFLSAIPLMIVVAIIANLVGKKITIMINSITVLIAFIVLYCSSNVTHIFIGQILQSFQGATDMVVIPMIFAEYTSPRYRGTFMFVNAATIYWGIWVSNAMGTFFYWKIIPLFGMICLLYVIVTVFQWPESPFWLASKGKFEECASSHRWLKGCNEESERELEALMNSHKPHPSHHTSRNSSKIENIKNLRTVIKSKEFYKPVFVSVAIICLSQYCGKAFCIVYALDIIKQITKSESSAYIGMLILDGVTVFSMYAGCIISQFVKRRSMVLVSSSIVAIFLFVLSLYLYLIKINVLFENTYVSIILLSMYSIASGGGPLMIGLAIFGEIVPTKFRNVSFCLTCLLAKISMGVLTKFTPALFETLGMHGFFLFFAISLSSVIFCLYKYLPETKDKTMQEISDNMRDIKTNNFENTGESLINERN